MSSEFWLGVAQTAFGSAVGFALGIGAFHYQQHRQSTKDEMKEWQAALDALNRLTTSAGANIEALVNAKLQLINNMKPEVEQTKAASEKVHGTKGQNRKEQLLALKAVSESTHYFYQSLPKISIMSPPDASEYSLLSKHMPALTLFVHRAMGSMQELNELIESRNALIAEHAREGGTGDGMSPERLVYFSSMLADQGNAIALNADFALDFWKLVLDQVKAYMTVRAKTENFVEYQLVPMAIEGMPKEEMFPLMREQLTTFED